jgi:hypothetical protein
MKSRAGAGRVDQFNNLSNKQRSAYLLPMCRGEERRLILMHWNSQSKAPRLIKVFARVRPLSIRKEGAEFSNNRRSLGLSGSAPKLSADGARVRCRFQINLKGALMSKESRLAIALLLSSVILPCIAGAFQSPALLLSGMSVGCIYLSVSAYRLS